MAKAAQPLKLCTCNIVGCGSKETWCHSRGEHVSGQWVSKAVFSRHQRADKNFSKFLVPDPFLCAYDNAMQMQTPLIQASDSAAADDADHDGNSVLESNTSVDPEDYDPALIDRVKEETYNVEEAIHDLQHAATVLGQIFASLSDSSSVLEFAVIPTKKISYQLFSSIPPEPNMGHQKLALKAPQNTHFLTQENELYRLFVALRSLRFPGNPILDERRCSILAQVEEGLFYVDRIRAAAWDRIAHGLATPDTSGSQLENAIVVNSGALRCHSSKIP